MEEIRQTPVEMLFNGIQGLILICGCGYFVLGYSEDTDSCLSSHNANSNFPLDSKKALSDDVIDVAQRWGIIYIVMMCAGALELIMMAAVVNKISGSSMKELVSSYDDFIRLKQLSNLANLVILISLIILTAARNLHPGKVCSGDFRNEYSNDVYYMLEAGVAIYWMLGAYVVCYLCGKFLKIELI